jgi:hypothetical protein
MFDKMTEQNYFLYAMHHYDNPNCNDIDEFKEDLNRLKYIKRLLNRYILTGDLKERLVLNHITVFCNVFGSDAAVKLMFFKLDKKLHSALKTFCIFLNIMPEIIYGVSDLPIYNVDIPVDMNVANILRKI